MPRRRATQRSRRSRACSGRRRAGTGCRPGRAAENCGPSASSRATSRSSTASRTSPSCGAGPGLAGEGADLELGRSGGADVAAGGGEELGRLQRAVRLGERLGADEQCLDPAAQVGRDAAAEERGVDAELCREPGDRLGGRARLAALDLADVLLREAIARDLGLRQPGSEAQRPQPLADAARQAQPASSPSATARRRELVVRAADRWWRRPSGVSVKAIHVSVAVLKRGDIGFSRVGFAGEVQRIANHLTELLDFFGHGTYSPDYQAPQPDARLWSVGHTGRIGGSKKESRAWAAESRASAVTPSRSPSLKRPRKPQPGAFLFSGVPAACARLHRSPRPPDLARIERMDAQTRRRRVPARLPRDGAALARRRAVRARLCRHGPRRRALARRDAGALGRSSSPAAPSSPPSGCSQRGRPGRASS